MKKSENPLIAEITKKHTKRVFNLSSIKLPEGLKKVCVWCLGPLSGQQRRWCGNECVESAQAWGSPQKEYGLGQLLIRQDFKCHHCLFDYGAIVEEMYKQTKLPYGIKEVQKTWRTTFSYWLMVKLKQYMHANNPSRKPEVDHTTPIYKGGLSLDLENLKCICYTCHKTKTKKDLSGKRKKDDSQENSD